jgi:hypothetical protein
MDSRLDLLPHFYTLFGTKSNYSAIADLHTLPAYASLFQVAVFPPVVVWQRILTVEILQLLCSRHYSPTANATTAPSVLSLPCRARLNCQPSIEISHSPTNYFSSLHSTELVKVKVKVKVMLRTMVSRPVCLGIKHPFEAYDQIVITVWRWQAFCCGALSLTRGRVCHLPESQSAVVSLLSVCTIYILHVIKRMYICMYV